MQCRFLDVAVCKIRDKKTEKLCRSNSIKDIYFIFHLSALKIHVSPFTKEILDQFGYFDLELRGTVEMKVRFMLNSACTDM